MKPWPLVTQLGETLCGIPSTFLKLPLKKQGGSLLHMLLCHSLVRVRFVGKLLVSSTEPAICISLV